MSADSARIERLIALAEKLAEALEGDIAALKAGRPAEMRSIDPEFQKLSLIYGREAAALNEAAAKSAPADLRARLIRATGRFREVLALQGRMLMRVRNASEGMIRAVAEEVERRRAPLRPYGPSSQQGNRAAGAIIYNSVV